MRRIRAWAAALALLAGGVAGAAIAADAQPATGSPEPLLVPDRIKTDTLVVLAHPDDEGTVAPLLARWALEERRRVVAIYVSSGEFGSNRVGAVRGPAFGFLRMTELHWTLDRLGVAMFASLGRSDRGRTDDPAAVLESWDRPRTLRELVRLIRLTRPERVLTWYPGPASGHADHIAAGAAALLAARGAASPAVSPEQMQTEGLRPHAAREILFVFQAEKVGYEAYPGAPGPGDHGPLAVEEIEVDVHSRALGRRYTDLAREAMREQRAVSAAANLGRGGPFDAPVRLIRVPGPGGAPPGAVAGSAVDAPEAARRRRAPGTSARDVEDAPSAPSISVTLSVEAAPTDGQRFLASVAAEAEVPELNDLFPPETPAPASIVALVSAPRGFRGRAELRLPEGWAAAIPRRDLKILRGGVERLTWTVAPPQGRAPARALASIVLSAAKGGAETARASLVLRRAGLPAAEAAPAP